jgi:hypothetical protein
MTSLTTRGSKINWVNWTKPGSYTWTVPINVRWIKGYIIGGGGGGGGGSASYGGGGGASSSAGAFQIPVTPGESLTIIVGSGGSGGTGGSSPTAGGNGGASQITFSDGTSLYTNVAGGGGAGSSTAGGSGGTAQGFAINNLRGLFITAITGVSGSAGSSSAGGNGGSSYQIQAWFTGLAFYAPINQVGSAGQGGSGGGLNSNGNAGNNGLVLILWEQ